MRKDPILVLTGVGEPQLPSVDGLRLTESVVVANSTENLHDVVGSVEIIFNWSGSLSLIREVFLMCRHLRWIHSRSAELEQSLFPELIASDVMLTNGRGAFSSSLGEFALAAILYFGKDLGRMIRSQMTGLWQPFDVTMVSGQTVGIVGYGDIGRAVAARARAIGMNVLGLKRHVPTHHQPDPLVDQIYGSDQRLETLSRCDYIVVAVPLNMKTGD